MPGALAGIQYCGNPVHQPRALAEQPPTARRRPRRGDGCKLLQSLFKILASVGSQRFGIDQDGKEIVVGNARNAPAASGAYDVSDANNLRWHEKGGSGILNDPASDGRMLETHCSER